MHKGVSLVSKDTEEGPRDGDRRGQITLNGSEGVSSRSAFEEEAIPQGAPQE